MHLRTYRPFNLIYLYRLWYTTYQYSVKPSCGSKLHHRNFAVGIPKEIRKKKLEASAIS